MHVSLIIVGDGDLRRSFESLAASLPRLEFCPFYRNDAGRTARARTVSTLRCARPSLSGHIRGVRFCLDRGRTRAKSLLSPRDIGQSSVDVDDVTGLRNPGDTEDLADRIRFLATHQRARAHGAASGTVRDSIPIVPSVTHWDSWLDRYKTACAITFLLQLKFQLQTIDRSSNEYAVFTSSLQYFRMKFHNFATEVIDASGLIILVVSSLYVSRTVAGERRFCGRSCGGVSTNSYGFDTHLWGVGGRRSLLRGLQTVRDVRVIRFYPLNFFRSSTLTGSLSGFVFSGVV